MRVAFHRGCAGDALCLILANLHNPHIGAINKGDVGVVHVGLLQQQGPRILRKKQGGKKRKKSGEGDFHGGVECTS